MKARVAHLWHRLVYHFHWKVLGTPKAGCYCDLKATLRTLTAAAKQ